MCCGWNERLLGLLDPPSFDCSRVTPINKGKPLAAQIFHAQLVRWLPCVLPGQNFHNSSNPHHLAFRAHLLQENDARKNGLSCAVLVPCQVSNKMHQMPPKTSCETVKHRCDSSYVKRKEFHFWLEAPHQRSLPPSQCNWSAGSVFWCVKSSVLSFNVKAGRFFAVWLCLRFLNIMILRKLQVQAQPFLKLGAIIPLGYPNLG